MTLVLTVFIVGFVYPVCAAAFYPVYKKLGGRDSFEEYMWKL